LSQALARVPGLLLSLVIYAFYMVIGMAPVTISVGSLFLQLLLVRPIASQIRVYAHFNLVGSPVRRLLASLSCLIGTKARVLVAALLASGFIAKRMRETIPGAVAAPSYSS